MVLDQLEDKMFSKSQKFQELLKPIEYLDDSIKNILIDIVMTDEFKKQPYEISYETVSLIQKNGRNININQKNDNITDAILLLNFQIRDDSHGASRLYKVIINSDIYDNLLTKYGFSQSTICKVSNVIVDKHSCVDPDKIIGYCSSKFDPVLFQNLFVVGHLKS